MRGAHAVSRRKQFYLMGLASSFDLRRSAIGMLNIIGRIDEPKIAGNNVGKLIWQNANGGSLHGNRINGFVEVLADNVTSADPSSSFGQLLRTSSTKLSSQRNSR
jgi:hypothetical protein